MPKSEGRQEFNVLQRINELREQHHMSMYRLSKLSGIPVNTLTAYANPLRRNMRPSISTIEAIAAKGFGMSLAEFFGGGPSPLGEEELELLSRWRALTPDEQRALLAVMSQLAQNRLKEEKE